MHHGTSSDPSFRLVGTAILASLWLISADVGADPVESIAREAPTTVERLDVAPDSDDAGCDPTADGDADVAELAADAPEDRTIPAVMPTNWRAGRGRQCQRYHRRQVCDGPRRVPEASAEAAALASDLGIDERTASHIAMTSAPPQPWVDAAQGRPSAGLLWPVEGGRFWRGFGRHREIVRARRGRLQRARRRILHPGVDIGAESGTPIRVVNDGLVVYSFNGMRGYGNSVLVLHGDGTVTLYAHCRATFVAAGERVRRGQVIAEVGDTGLAHGAHLHFEWRRDGRPLDPLQHFVGRADAVDVDGPRASLDP